MDNGEQFMDSGLFGLGRPFPDAFMSGTAMPHTPQTANMSVPTIKKTSIVANIPTVGRIAMDMEEKEDNNQYIYPRNLPEAMRLLEDALSGESADRQFYEFLMGVAPSEDDRKIITGIRDDEIEHYKLFKVIRRNLTGMSGEVSSREPFVRPKDYCSGLKSAMMGELNAVRKYRQILFALQDRTDINMLFRIITDELRHSVLYTYLYSKNKCSE